MILKMRTMINRMETIARHLNYKMSLMTMILMSKTKSIKLMMMVKLVRLERSIIFSMKEVTIRMTI